MPPSPPFDPVAFGQKMMALYQEAQPLMAQWMAQQAHQAEENPMAMDPLNMRHAMVSLFDYYARNPAAFADLQYHYWDHMAKLTSENMNKWMGKPAYDVVKPGSDRRFKDPMWTQNAAFDYLRQSYALTRDLAEQLVSNARGVSAADRQKLEFATKQYLDALSPTNFPWTNPEVMRATAETGGENLVKGMQNLIEDLKRGGGALKISTTQYEAFQVGKNLATTEGQVVYRGRMMELIQYTPTTKTVHEIPLLIVPPWINKYYVLDMRSDNSFVKFAVDQGFTVFMISWVNPDPSYADILFDDYLQDGLIQALNVIEDITKEKTTNIVGYCIGGTLTSMAMAWLKAKGQEDRIHSATLLTTLLDYEKAGDMKVFIDEAQIDALESRMRQQGYLEAAALQKTFSILRANDLIWSFVVNNYLLGKEPFPFDLLYWNEDSTNLPAAFHAYYLRHLYLRNDLIKPEVLTIGGVKIDLGTIKTPLYFLSAREDHIAPWGATFDGARRLGHTNSHLTFVLAASGHVAGVVNPATSTKYGYWTRDQLEGPAEHWVKEAPYTAGSWWPHWARWLSSRAGKHAPAPKNCGNELYAPICPAPGTYVKMKA